MPAQTSRPTSPQTSRTTSRTRAPMLRWLALALVTLLLHLAAQLPSASAANTTVLCRCDCGTNSTILSVPSCIGCTKAFCINSGICFLPPLPPGAANSSAGGNVTTAQAVASLLAAAAASAASAAGAPGSVSGPGKEAGDAPAGIETWAAICFQRGSYKDEIIVYSFLGITTLLLVFALIKPYVARYIRDHQISLPAMYYRLLDDER
ncbi:hypothetical protein BC831DRAFT_463932 [Entophlyctis helioformis]|nr:hypothetical protein BC831DRAFT_463932 [Entophlyctis helioformis]